MGAISREADTKRYTCIVCGEASNTGIVTWVSRPDLWSCCERCNNLEPYRYRHVWWQLAALRAVRHKVYSLADLGIVKHEVLSVP